MDSLFPIVIAIVVVSAVVAILVGTTGRKSGGGKSKGKKHGKQKNRSQIIHDATKKLTQDPHNPEALIALSDLYFAEHLWDKAYPLYDTMYKVSSVHPEIDAFIASVRAGVCAVMLDKIPEALASLAIAYKMNPHDFDVNYNLGLAFYKNKEFDKAIPCLKKALAITPETEGIYFILGQCLYRAKHFKESLGYLKKALDEDPQNKEALFDMADAMAEEGMGEKAMKVFIHLRPDPVFGARSCLSAGIIHAKNNNHEAAIQDFEIGLRHEGMDNDLKLETEYRLAMSYFATNDMAKGLQELRKVQAINPTYKDVVTLINRYQELNQNTNLQTYLMAGSSDFVALCRNIALTMYSTSTVKIQDINVGPVFTDIFAEVESPKWKDIEIFRFYRTTGSTGELYIRDFYGHMHDVKADRGFCLTAGTFTEEARKFVDGRPIDLIEKDALIKILKKIN